MGMFRQRMTTCFLLLVLVFNTISSENQTEEEFIVKVNQKSAAAKRSFCCFFAKDHCSEPCAGKKCSANCIVECGEDGVFKCPGISCRDSTPKSCTPGPSTITSTTSTVCRLVKLYCGQQQVHHKGRQPCG